MGLRLIADENIPAKAIAELRRRGHDVRSVVETMSGRGDEAILACAQRENRIVATQDKDFAELAFQRRLPADCGVILFRLSGRDPETDARRIIETLEYDLDWKGHFAVVTHDRIRIKPLPRAT